MPRVFHFTMGFMVLMLLATAFTLWQARAVAQCVPNDLNCMNTP